MMCSNCQHRASAACPLQQKVLFVPETRDVITKGYCDHWQPKRYV